MILKNKNEKSIIVDGGVLSNFPMWLFDKGRERPVIGIKLSHKMEELPKNKINNAIQLFTALFETMKDAHDARYISRIHEKDIIFRICIHITPGECTVFYLRKPVYPSAGGSPSRHKHQFQGKA